MRYRIPAERRLEMLRAVRSGSTHGALVSLMKQVERTTIDAALTGSRELAVKALALHPLVPSVVTARAIFDGYRERLPAIAEAFAA